MNQSNPATEVDELAVYNAAVERREKRRREREERQNRCAEAAAKRRRAEIVVMIVAIVAAVVMVAAAVVTVWVQRVGPERKATESETGTPWPGTEAPRAVPVVMVTEEVWVPVTNGFGEDAQEAEKIVDALVADGYFYEEIPIPFEWQDYFRTAAEQYGGDRAYEVFILALSVADWETRGRFNMNAIGGLGEVGIMQLLPGPDNSYHAELEAVTGLDVHTPAGNIAAGVYKLATYLHEYDDYTKAAMAYNMGAGGARNAWASGIASTEYSEGVLAAMAYWSAVIRPWNET